MDAAQTNVYFGTSGRNADGIYHSLFNDKNGRLSNPKRVAELASPGFLAIHPDKSCLYAVSKTGDIASYNIKAKGELELTNKANTGDGGSAHLAVHPAGKYLITAQYGGGSVSLFPIDEKGVIKDRVQLIEHEGASKAYEKRQESPHPHWSGFSPDGRFAFIPDLGIDKIVIYKVDLSKGNLTKHSSAETPTGSGPRHMKFSNDGNYIYLLNELSLTIATFKYNKEEGLTELIKITKTLSDEIKEKEMKNTASEILVHPNSKYLYSANRGHDSISVFEIEKNNNLKLLEIESSRVSWPRNINFDLSANWLLTAGQFSNAITVFKIDSTNGELQFQHRNVANVPNPTCILFNPHK